MRHNRSRESPQGCHYPSEAASGQLLRPCSGQIKSDLMTQSGVKSPEGSSRSLPTKFRGAKSSLEVDNLCRHRVVAACHASKIDASRNILTRSVPAIPLDLFVSGLLRSAMERTHLSTANIMARAHDIAGSFRIIAHSYLCPEWIWTCDRVRAL